jgi:hypothetical protein
MESKMLVSALRSAIFVGLVSAMVAPAWAQSSNPPAGTLAGQLDSLRGLEISGVTPVVIQSITNQLSTFPLGTSSGGFTYSFDPALGIVSRSTQSFGPAFAERALTNGRGKVSIGFNYQQVSYDHLGGEDSSQISLGSAARMSVNLKTQTAALFADAGLSDRFDVAVVVPVTRVTMDVQFEALIGNFGPPLKRSGVATGVGDVSIRTKYSIAKSAGSGVAAGADLRLPTGDSNNLLGTGRPRATLYGIGSAEIGPVEAHVNGGVSFDMTTSELYQIGNERREEFVYALGLTVAATRAVTIVGDITGRSILDNVQTAAALTHGSAIIAEYPVLGSAGVKINIHGHLLASVNALLPLTRSGLTASFVPSVGFDYSF